MDRGRSVPAQQDRPVEVHDLTQLSDEERGRHGKGCAGHVAHHSAACCCTTANRGRGPRRMPSGGSGCAVWGPARSTAAKGSSPVWPTCRSSRRSIIRVWPWGGLRWWRIFCGRAIWVALFKRRVKSPVEYRLVCSKEQRARRPVDRDELAARTGSRHGSAGERVLSALRRVMKRSTRHRSLGWYWLPPGAGGIDRSALGPPPMCANPT